MVNHIQWLDNKIYDLIEKAQSDDYRSLITDTDVATANELAKARAYSTCDFFVLLNSINLLNTAIKRPEYKHVILPVDMHTQTSELIQYLISLDFYRYQLDLFINPNDKYAYIEVYNIQFSFRNFTTHPKISAFAEGGRNKIKPWKGINLQKIAGELLNLAIEYKAMINK
jgi:hypothetical protein